MVRSSGYFSSGHREKGQAAVSFLGWEKKPEKGKARDTRAPQKGWKHGSRKGRMWNPQMERATSFSSFFWRASTVTFFYWMEKEKKKEKDEANKMKEKEGCVECNFTGRHADVCCFPRGCSPCCFSLVASFSLCLAIASRFREFYL